MKAKMFIIGFSSSILGEIIPCINKVFIEKQKLPLYYKKPIYWVNRFIIAITGGILVVIYEIEDPVAAIHIGFSMPFLIAKKFNK